MIYIFTDPDCPKCHAKIKEFKENNIEFEERSSKRLTQGADDHDVIDAEALAELAFNDYELPVIIGEKNSVQVCDDCTSCDQHPKVSV